MTVLVEPTRNGGVRVTSGGLTVDLAETAVTQIAALRRPLEREHSGAVVLPEEHPMWEHHSGGGRHAGSAWKLSEDVDGAKRLRRHLAGKACGEFFDLVLSEPGRLFTSEQIVASCPNVFSSANAVAGSLAGFVKPTEELGRPFPFFWWEGSDGAPTRYAVRPSVAAVFAAAGD